MPRSKNSEGRGIIKKFFRDKGAEKDVTQIEEIQPDAQKNITHLIGLLRSRIVSQNIVLIRLLAICTLLAATTALKNGLLLCFAAAIVTIPLYIVMELLEKRLPEVLYLPSAAFIAGIIITPVCIFSSQFAPEVTSSVGIFLPITAINAALMVEFNQKAKNFGIIDTITCGFGDVLGLSAVIIFISVIREVVGSGTLYGRSLPEYAQLKFGFALLPSGAFLLFALLLGAVQGYRIAKDRKNGKGENN